MGSRISCFERYVSLQVSNFCEAGSFGGTVPGIPGLNIVASSAGERRICSKLEGGRSGICRLRTTARASSRAAAAAAAAAARARTAPSRAR
eukprot:4457894-Alexandrium_andersonii.AAC.4